MPPIETILIERPDPLGPYGAKGVGEPALVADRAGDPERHRRGDRRAHDAGAGDARPRAGGAAAQEARP